MLIDGHALVHRAFHAVPEDLSTSSGEPTNAVFGFSNIVLKEIETVKPTHVVMALDRPAPTFRHQAYAQYKATRPRTPAPLIPQFERVREVAAAMNIALCELDGYEADDVLGTLSRQAELQEIPTAIVTGDLDALQLVSDLVTVRTPARNFSDDVTYGPAAVQERYGIEQALLPDWKAMVGDVSDNIPGVPGIGPKGATVLLQKYGSLEGIFDHLEELPERQRRALAPSREQALQSRELSRIIRDAPVTLDLEHSAFRDADRAALIRVFADLEFHSLIRRLQAAATRPEDRDATSPTEQPTQLSIFGPAEEVPTVAERDRLQGSFVANTLGLMEEPAAVSELSTRIVRSPDDLADLVRELSEARTFAVDSETTSTDPLRARLVGLSFAARPDHAWYVPVGHAEGEQLPLPAVLDALRVILEDDTYGKVGHNLKYDLEVLSQHGVELAGLDFDTMIAAYLARPRGRGLSLSALAISRLGVEMLPIESLIGKGKAQITMDLVDIDRVAHYAGADAEVAVRLREILCGELAEAGVEALFHEVEMPLVPVLASMELEGVALDTRVLAAMSRDMTEVMGRLEGQIYELAGHRFNINSTQQLGQVLFQELKLPQGRRTKTGYSTDNEVLENLRGRHPIVDSILEFRQLLKLKSTYVDALPALINPETGKLHTDFNQTVASTGRLSSSNPNLQNIPVRGDLGRKIRKAFVPSRSENLLLGADYSQIELRILAVMSGDPRLMDAFLSGDDIHRATASAVFGVPLEAVTPDQRRIAKVVNFGIIYGIGEARLAYETGISRAEAREFIANYNLTYAGVKTFMDTMRKRAAFDGYVTTMLNRRRYTPEIHSENPGIRTAAERAAINMPIQGTAADIIKIAMIRLHDQLRKRFPEAHMILQVHDELVFDVPTDDLGRVSELVRDTMEHAFDLGVPLEVELKVGRDWYDMAPLAHGA